MGVSIYIGKNTDKEKRYVELKENEANHITFLGPSGSGKTTVMRAIAEEIFQNIPGALVVVIEQKYDKNKAKDLMDFLTIITKKKGPDFVKENFQPLLQYYNILKNDGVLHGKPGDFAFGWPNYPFTLYPPFPGDKHSILSWHGLKPKAFPVKRIVFRPVRNLEAIEKDNNCIAREGKIRYKDVDFDFIARLAQINRNTIYGRVIRQAWDLEKKRDPDELERFGYEWEKNTAQTQPCQAQRSSASSKSALC